MRIFGLKQNHDGCCALVEGGRLCVSIEAEKASHARHARLRPYSIFDALARCDGIPDVIAVGGWHLDPSTAWENSEFDLPFGYMGLEHIYKNKYRICGKDITLFASSHERSHIMACYGLSPFPQRQPCYVLIWEGTIGSFYEIDEHLQVTRIGTPLTAPGMRYSYLYFLGSADVELFGYPGLSSGPGKLMALSGYGIDAPLEADDRRLVDFLLTGKSIALITSPLFCAKKTLPIKDSIVNSGVCSQRFKNLAKYFSDRIFDVFRDFARTRLTKRYPLLIGGGCGLNCDWNTKWRGCGLFQDVFVPPCANDSGSAIGTAVDAQWHLTGCAKIDWSVYAGEEFVFDEGACNVRIRDVSFDEVAEFLYAGTIIAWVSGRYEIGPRALGNRSLLAEPFNYERKLDLNRIKGREDYRPIAPICALEDVALHFDVGGENPHMLYFGSVKNPSLRAVTHIDGSARVQTVSRTQNKEMHTLLACFRKRSGAAVLCNTSLNRKGRGFINKLSDLVAYMREVRVSVAIVNGKGIFLD